MPPPKAGIELAARRIGLVDKHIQSKSVGVGSILVSAYGVTSFTTIPVGSETRLAQRAFSPKG